MGREERRKKAKQDKKINDKKVEAMRWVQSLPPAKAELISSYAKMIADRDNKNFIDAIDRCYTAAIAIEFEEKEWEEIQNVMETFLLLIEQDAKKMRKLQDKSGGNIDMATKKVNEQAPAVEERVRGLLAEGKKQKEIIEILSVEFNSLSRAMLTNAFKKTKQIIKQEQVGEAIAAGEKVRDLVNRLGDPDVDTEKLAEYIIEDKETEYAQEEEITVEELDKTITVEEAAKLETVDSKFKLPTVGAPFGNSEAVVDDELEVINEVRIVDLKGKYATYHAENKTVEVNGELSFMDAQDVMFWADEEIMALEKRIAAIKGQAKETIKVIKKYL